MRHADVSCGRDVTITLPRKSVRWSSVFMARLSICLPTSPPPIRPPMAPPMPPTTLPAALPIWPVMRMLPLSGVMMVNVFDWPVAYIVPRETVSPISAWPSSCVTGLSFLPANSRGVAVSSVWPIAASETATGAMTWEARVTGCNGGGGFMMASASGKPLSDGGKKRLIAHKVAAKRRPATQAAARPQRK
jgi:hypothetical protein